METSILRVKESKQAKVPLKIQNVLQIHVTMMLENLAEGKKCLPSFIYLDFPDSSVGKESTYNTGDPGSIPGSGRSVGEAIGYPVFLDFPVAQLVRHPPTIRETWVQSLGWEDPLEKGKATHSNTLAWRIPWTVQGPKELDTTERLSLSLSRHQ